LTDRRVKAKEKGKKGRGKRWLMCGPCPAVKETRMRLAGGAGGLIWLLGRRVKGDPLRAFGMAGPVGVQGFEKKVLD
jgi:hypothetical protein